MKKGRLLGLGLALVLCLTACQQKAAELPTEPEMAVTEATFPTAATQAAAEPTQPIPEPEDGEFVRILDYIPTARQELYYGTEQNFTGQIIYPFTEAYLRYGTVKKLVAVSEELAEMGLYLKIWDGFRPVSAQFKLWEVCPDPTYVANPNAGFSSHSRGNTVDLTLVDASGAELKMPTGFDDFSAKADRDYSDCDDEAAHNAKILEEVMGRHGFTGYYGEWWHFSDTDSYPVEEVFQPNAG